MGKSSLMVHTAGRLAEEGVRTVIIDLTQLGATLTPNQWYVGLIDEIVEQLDLDVDAVAWWEQHAHFGPTQRLSRFLRQVVLEAIPDPVVLFVDEIDSTLKLEFTDDFFAAIRAAYNARANDSAYKRLTFVLLGVARPEDLVKDRVRTPYNIGVKVDITDFRLEELGIFQAALEETSAGQGAEALRWVLAWTGGHPYLTQKLCAAVAERSDGRLTEGGVDGLVERLFLGEEARKESNLRAVQDRILSSPQAHRLLRLYRDVLKGRPVRDDERSHDQSELKLAGLVRVTPQSSLAVRNRLYQRVFDEAWLKANTPSNTSQRVAIIASVVAVLALAVAGFLFYQQQRQPDSIRAQTFIQGFQSSQSPEVQLTNLAGLFGLGDVYADQARKLFFELGAQEQLALFSQSRPRNVGAELIIVAQGLYQQVENTPEGMRLLNEIETSIRKVESVGATGLAIEIRPWLQGRRSFNEGRYSDAIVYYTDTWGESQQQGRANVSALFDRAVAYVLLQRYDEALADFEEVMVRDPRHKVSVIEQISSEPPLLARWAETTRDYPALSQLVGWKINFAMNDLSGLTGCDSVTHRFNKAQEMRHVWSEAQEVQVEIKG